MSTICKGLGADEIIDARELSGAGSRTMVRAYIEDVFNRISIALGSKLKWRLASGRFDLAALLISVL